MPGIKAILFDFGGVLIDFVGLDEIGKLISATSDPGTAYAGGLRSRWISSPAVSAFERGDCSPEEFASCFVEEWGLEIEPQRFLEAFTSWIKGTLPGTEAMLADLRPHFTLACLSNTNEAHWARIMNDCGMGAQLHRHYASHLIGRLKPDPEIFRVVCVDMGLAPHEVVFFDDGDENVAGAERIGLSAFKVHNPGEIRATLTELGLFPEA